LGHCDDRRQRLDGKSVTPIAGSDDHDPLRVSGRIEATNLELAQTIYEIIQGAEWEAEQKHEKETLAKLLKPVPADTDGDPTE
jgi:hypothetical protein